MKWKDFKKTIENTPGWQDEDNIDFLDITNLDEKGEFEFVFKDINSIVTIKIRQ